MTNGSHPCQGCGRPVSNTRRKCLKCVAEKAVAEMEVKGEHCDLYTAMREIKRCG